jgi:hypothetical protein
MQRTKKIQKRKQAKRSLKQALNATVGMPTNCTACDTEFDPVEDADTWMVEFGKKEIKLLCPKCV